MSRFIDLIETFDFTSLDYEPYGEKIDDLLKRFPKYENDDRFRTVLPNKFNKTADDYVSIKFCIKGRYPIYGIYNRRDLNLVGVCVHENIMYALDDCDLHPSFVPDLNVRKLCLEIQYSPLATRETLNYTRKCMCSAISTLSLGYTPQKKNEWCEAVVLLTGMTSQAVRFCKMKEHVQTGLLYTTADDVVVHDGRYVYFDSEMALLNRWNKVSKAIRRREYPYVFTLYADYGPFDSDIVVESSAGCQVSLINDNDKTKGEKFRRRIHKWNGPLGNRQRKVEEEFIKKWYLEEEQRRLKRKWFSEEEQLKMDDKFSETMHGFWFGSVDTFKNEVTSVKCLRRSSQMDRDNRYLESETPPLNGLKVVLQFRKPLASVRWVIKSIWNDAGILSFSRGTSMMLENQGSGSYFWLNKPNQSLPAVTHSAIVDCACPVLAAATSNLNLCAKHLKVSTCTNNFCLDEFGISKEKIVPRKVKWNQEHRPFVQLDSGMGAVGETCVCPLQVITRRIQARHFNANGYPDMSHYFKRTLQHESFKGLVRILLNILPSGRAATKLKQQFKWWI